MKLLSLALLVILCGCEVRTRIDSKPSESKPDRTLEIANWQLKYSDVANHYTQLTNQCISEMYARVFAEGTVDGGPMCRQSCAVLKEANDFVDTAPAYIDDPHQYWIGWSKICPDPARAHKKRTYAKKERP